MIINFIGNFQNGAVGEVADETHIARELEQQGHFVQRIPRDIWKAICDGETDPNWVWPGIADINIICKWHHFNDRKYIDKLRNVSDAPVFYWVWDWMADGGIIDWHKEMAIAADLYLGNDVNDITYHNAPIKKYYFPFDVADGELAITHWRNKEYDVSFFGSYLQQGDRIAWLKEINKVHPIKIFSVDYKQWQKEGFDAEPAVWGETFNQKVALSKIVLGFNVNDHIWGYWSNRVGKTITAGGFLLQRYVPGMELFLKDAAVYFSSIQECNEKIDFYLYNEGERRRVVERTKDVSENFTSRQRVRELVILIDRFLKGGL